MYGAVVSVPPHALDADVVVATLDVDPHLGLRADQVEARRAAHGRNELRQATAPSTRELLVRQFDDPLVWLLVVAGAISGLVLGERVDAAVILAIVVLDTLLGFTQESRAERALADLRDLHAPRARVVRDGVRVSIPARDLVPGDVVELEAGDRVPGDARLVASEALLVDEAVLTGESYPVEKSVTPVVADSVLGDRTDMVFLGTAVQRGRARAVVTATGAATEMGAIADLLAEGDEPPTPLQRDLQRLGRLIAVLAVLVAAGVFGLGVVRGYAVGDMFLTTVALAVAAIPEGLPAVVTITLANGVRDMARNSAVVRRLTAVEGLGEATVICTDKTGTVTRNEIAVQAVVLDDDDRVLEPDNGGPLAADAAVAELYGRVASLCNDARPGGGGSGGDPTEVALVVSAARFGADVEGLRTEWPRLDAAAFTSERMRMGTLHAAPDGRRFLAVKGSPEVMVPRATHVQTPDGPRPLHGGDRHRLLEHADALAADGLRTLTLAYRWLESAEVVDLAVEALETNLIVVATVGMSDPVRDGIAGAVAEADVAGIRTVLITGDHRNTARAVGREIGVLDGRRVMTGDQLHALTPDEFAARVEDVAVYARVEPRDKVAICQGWQARGGVVAMTGDGVNDAPALKAADIGIAMGSGTDVARDAADIVLTDDDFTTIVRAVREGRRIFDNLQKVVWFLLSSNISEIVVIALAMLVAGHLGQPLLPTQILWMNLVTDGLPVIALGVDGAERGIMRRPALRAREILGRRQLRQIVLYGSVLALAALGVLAVGLLVQDREIERVRTMVFTTLVLGQLLHALNMRALRASVFRGFASPNRFLTLALLASAALQVAVVQLPVGHELFETVPLTWAEWGVCVGLSLVGFVVIDLLKRYSPAPARTVRSRP